uniref:Uncharacterized protein n=2 Tax=Nothobranchius korthausae TaxID=1143690 RepID=A0A1A8EL86_9TELE
METVFSRFDSYNFETDQRFVDGLKTLNMSDRSGERSELLDLKLFFYNRFVEPIEQHSYKTWSSSRGTASKFAAERQDQKAPSHSDSNICENRRTETSANTQTTHLSFAEVMQLVQEGKEVPGVSKLDIEPCNQSPTPSQMQRVLKPWETA